MWTLSQAFTGIPNSVWYKRWWITICTHLWICSSRSLKTSATWTNTEIPLTAETGRQKTPWKYLLNPPCLVSRDGHGEKIKTPDCYMSDIYSMSRDSWYPFQRISTCTANVPLPDSIQIFSHCWFRTLAAASKWWVFPIFLCKIGRTTLKNDLW